MIEAHATPTTIVVNTCDQPSIAARCLASLVHHLDRWEHRPRIVLADDSRSAAHARANAELVAALPTRFRPTHLGPAHKLALSRRLADAVDLDPRVLAFALGDPIGTGYTLGANLVAALLVAAGEVTVFLDEDMQLDAYRTVRHPAAQPAGGPRPLPARWYAQPEEVEPLRVDVDLVAAHGQWLGRVAEGRRIVATSTGVCGFTGCADATLDVLLTADEQLRGDELRLAAVLERPRALCVADRVIVNRGEGWTSASIGIDGRELVPPFLPAGRGTDLLWAVTTVATREDAGFVQLPWALAHDRPTKSADATLRPVSIWSLLADLTLSSMHASAPTDTAARLVALGQRVEIVVRDGIDALREWTFDLHRSCRARVRQQVRRALGMAPGACALWRSSLEQRLEHVAAAPDRPLPPRDAPFAAVDEARAWRATLEIFELYGRLLVAWPDLVAAARTHARAPWC